MKIEVRRNWIYGDLCFNNIMSNKEFLCKSNYYNPNINAFDGFFDVDLKHVTFMFDHYIKTNEYLVDEYVQLIHLSWEVGNNYFYDKDELDFLDSIQSKFRKLNFLDYEILADCRIKIKESRDFLRKQNDFISQQPRKEAQAFIKKKNIREFIFKRDNYSCLRCGSKEKLSIDHIVSVYNKGKNTIGNLQTLCKSCNSKKSNSYKDYRNG